MKKIKLILSILGLIFSIYIRPQSEIILNSVRTEGGTETACDSIFLQPGFSFTASNGKSLLLQINPLICTSGENGKDILSEKGLPSFTDENFIYTISYTHPTTKVDASKGLESAQYFDGLGRPYQTVQRAITPNGSDLVVYQEYDNFGRESKVWLPGVSQGNGAIVHPENIGNLVKASHKGDNNPFSRPVYEPSPLNRIVEQYGPGEKWYTQEASVKTAYLTNNDSDLACISYTVTSTRDNPGLSKGSNYTAGELYVTKITDEAGSESYEFKDKLGRVVLIRQIGPDEKDPKKEVNYDTYYVYDDYGNPCFVLPPKAANNPTDGENLINYVYQYKYDERNRCIAKKIPGAEWVNYVYDKADRLILSQDGEQRKKNQWTYNKYDALGRLLISGFCTTNMTHDAIRSLYKNVIVKENVAVSWYGYTWQSLKEVGVTDYQGVFIINYYDDYDTYIGQWEGAYDTKLKYQAKTGFDTRYYVSGQPSGRLSGKLVGTRVKYFNPDNTISSGEITMSYFYDNRGRIIQTRTVNHLGGLDVEYIAYNFTGQPVNKLIEHEVGGQTTKEFYTYTYDHAGRLLETSHKMGDDGQEIILAKNEYDDLGRLKSTKANGNDNLKISYAYNIRSWTETINNPNYYQNMGYTLNGNLDWMKWRQNNTEHVYNFEYDKLSRLTAAIYQDNNKYSTAYTYDMHGNMMTLGRKGQTAPSTYGEIDRVTFEYNGNQMKKATDAIGNILLATSMDFKDYEKNAAVEYDYNANGAMIMDLNRGVKNITYNSLNLPQTMEISNTSQGKAYYTYSATGQKLRIEREHASTLRGIPVSGLSTMGIDDKEKTDYVGNFIYEGGNLKRILIDNGYIEDNNYYFYVRDHLGNNRIVTDASGVEVVQSNEYYPFGMLMASSTNPDKQPYKYGNKELDTSFDLNWYDFSARYQDGIRFTSIDPLSEKYYSISPYAYVANNPMRFVDPDGRQVGYPPGSFGGIDWKSAKKNYIVNKTFEDNSRQIGENAILGTLSYTDINDATVIGTTITRNGNAINIDGTSASTLDKGAAILGAFLPVVSGSTAKGVLKSVAKFFGFGADAGKKALKISKGQNIVGSNFDEVLPTQDWINPLQVDHYKKIIQAGEEVPAVRAYRQGDKIYIEDGHHRFAAYKELGVEPKMTISEKGGPIGYPNWSSTTYQKSPY